MGELGVDSCSSSADDEKLDVPTPAAPLDPPAPTWRNLPSAAPAGAAPSLTTSSATLSSLLSLCMRSDSSVPGADVNTTVHNGGTLSCADRTVDISMLLPITTLAPAPPSPLHVSNKSSACTTVIAASASALMATRQEVGAAAHARRRRGDVGMRFSRRPFELLQMCSLLQLGSVLPLTRNPDPCLHPEHSRV